jgi:hypothetical protein
MAFQKIKQNLQSDFVKRQFYMMSNLGLFYIILIALFGIPLLATCVVVLIQGVLDFRLLILGVGIVVIGITIFISGRWLMRLMRKIRTDGLFSFREARRRAETGEQVQIEFLGGLVSLSMGGGRAAPALLTMDGASCALPAPDDPGSGNGGPDPVRQLQGLQRLHQDGIIDETELHTLKKRIIARAAPPPPAGDPDGHRAAGSLDDDPAPNGPP